MSLEERKSRADEIMKREFPEGGPGFGDIHFVFLKEEKIWIARIEGVLTGVQLRELANAIEIMNSGAAEDAEAANVEDPAERPLILSDG